MYTCARVHAWICAPGIRGKKWLYFHGKAPLSVRAPVVRSRKLNDCYLAVVPACSFNAAPPSDAYRALFELVSARDALLMHDFRSRLTIPPRHLMQDSLFTCSSSIWMQNSIFRIFSSVYPPGSIEMTLCSYFLFIFSKSKNIEIF